jgi:hypothetical protein
MTATISIQMAAQGSRDILHSGALASGSVGRCSVYSHQLEDLF